MNSYSKDSDGVERNVSVAALESALAPLKEANKRLAFILALETIILGLVIGGLFYFFTNFDLNAEAVMIDSHDGTANYIGNDGDIVNGGN